METLLARNWLDGVSAEASCRLRPWHLATVRLKQIARSTAAVDDSCPATPVWYHQLWDLMRPERIPLFPLNVVLLPGADLPLHIFEPRYRQMVRRVHRGQNRIRNAPVASQGHCARRLHRGDHGGREAVQRRSDGHPHRRTRAISHPGVAQRRSFSEDALLEGHVDYLDDRERACRTRASGDELVELYEVCHTIVFDDYPRNIQARFRRICRTWWRARLPMDLMWKQQVLELRSEADRQERLVAYLREWAPHLQKEESLRQHADGNGHGLN